MGAQWKIFNFVKQFKWNSCFCINPLLALYSTHFSLFTVNYCSQSLPSPSNCTHLSCESRFSPSLMVLMDASMVASRCWLNWASSSSAPSTESAISLVSSSAFSSSNHELSCKWERVHSLLHTMQCDFKMLLADHRLSSPSQSFFLTHT